MTVWITVAVLTFGSGVGAGVWYRRWRRRRIEARRVVERPNSHYSSVSVKQRESRGRWGRIDIGRLHPLNRDEVQRLLTIADQAGVGALSSKDQLFLDNMTMPRRR